MNKKIVIAAGVFILLSSLMIISSAKDEAKQEESSSGIVLFYGDTCPHCKIVDAYVEENKIKEKIAFVDKEVYNNRANALELQKKAEICGLPSDNIGVPFLFDNGRCLIGDKDIIDYFSSKL